MSELRNTHKLVEKLHRWRELLDETVGEDLDAQAAFEQLSRELEEAYLDAVHDRHTYDQLEAQLRAASRTALSELSPQGFRR